MQQAVRWRRRRRAAWQVVAARWLLALAILIALCPSGSGRASVVRAQDRGADDGAVERTVEAPPKPRSRPKAKPPASPADAGAVVPAVEAAVGVPAAEAAAGVPSGETATGTHGSGRAVFAPPPSIDAAAAAPGVPPAPEQSVRQADEPGVAAPAERSYGAPAAGPAPAAGAAPAAEPPRPGRGAAASDDPDDGDVPPVRGNRRVAASDAAEACPAELSALKSASFKRDDRLVMTYYYYWYDQASLDDPAMAQRPPNDPLVDWRSVNWHERQLLDMATAGVDVALAVYWGNTSEWSVAGLKPMVQARENLIAAGIRAPAIGLFFDTNMYALILPERPELADFTTDDGQAMLAHQIGIFFDQVPPCHRARVDGRPLAFFWRADTEDGDRFTFDDRTFSGLNDLVQADHGERLHFVLEHTWQVNARASGVELGAADVYRWGAALNGPRFEGRTVAVGPGYDDRQIAGRPGYLRDRVDGETYSRDLRLAVMSGSPWLLLETWNELWEGTAISETEQTGRTYLGITARYAALFHQLGGQHARDGWFDLGSGQNAYVRRLADQPVEQGEPAGAAGRWGARPLREDDGTGYFHFALDRRLGLAEARPLTVFVEYFDDGDGTFAVEYDSLDGEAPEAGVYKVADTVHLEDSRTWQLHRFELADASLRARQYDGGGDFRIHARPGTDERLPTFGRVTVTAAPAIRPVAFEPESLSFVDAAQRRPVGLRWSEPDAVPGYLVVVQPLTAAGEPEVHGFTVDDRRRCDGEVETERGQATFGLARRATCDLRLASDLDEGIYRWRVQALDANGGAIGEPSDWAFFVVARR